MAGGPCDGWVSYRWHHNHRFLVACPLGPSVESSVLSSPCRARPCAFFYVRLKDSHNTEHSVVVYAESLYEAVLRGLSRLQDVGWESHGNETIQRVEVEIHQEPTRHIVDVPKLLKWIEEKSMYPAQQTKLLQCWKTSP